MVLPRYLAQTAEEFTAGAVPPAHMAWMACHFSPYGTGLVNLPPVLPPNAMVILNDRIPMAGHDPDTVIAQLMQLEPDSLLLDFQRPPEAQTLALVRSISASLSCPVGAPPVYCHHLQNPLFLPLLPPDRPLAEYLAPWHGRELWLEIGSGAITYAVTETGAVPGILPAVPRDGLADRALLCHYRIMSAPDRAVFEIWRTREDLEKLLEQAAPWGVTRAVGLWQELRG